MKKEMTTQLRHLTAKINVLGYIIANTKNKNLVKKKLSDMSKMLEEAKKIAAALERCN